MKVKAHIRVAKHRTGRKGFMVSATTKPSLEPLYTSTGQALPTAAFALDLDIPDVMFARAEEVLAEVSVTSKMAEVAAKVKKIEE